MDYPWLYTYQQQFADMLLRKKPPHGILLTGGKGLGKYKLAQKMAQMALCENLSNDGACQNCPACELFYAGNHTDYSHICAEKASIKVDQIRHMTQKVILTNTRNQYKIILIQEAELMNKAAANALLKTLEEPPAKVILILTSNEIGRLLPTIKSRCMKWSITPPAIKQVSDWLNLNSKQSQQDREFSLMLNSTAPLEALAMLENNNILTIKEMLKDLHSLTDGSKSILDVSKDWISHEQHHFLSFIAAYFLLSVKQHYNISYSYETENSTLNPLQLLAFIKEIYQYKKRSTTVLKPQLLLEELLLKWKNIYNSAPPSL